MEKTLEKIREIISKPMQDMEIIVESEEFIDNLIGDYISLIENANKSVVLETENELLVKLLFCDTDSLYVRAKVISQDSIHFFDQLGYHFNDDNWHHVIVMNNI